LEVLFHISAALVVGLLMTRVIKPFKLPAVTAYLIAGILIGPYCLGLLGIKGLGFTSMEEVKALKIISDVALGFIAFAIGNEFRVSQLRQNGKQATVIGILQAVLTTLVVDAILVVLHFAWLGDKLPLSVCLTLGAIAAATAPAATLMVIRQYKAKGPLTRILLPIVALDDAVGLMIFAVSFGVARALESGTVDVVSIVVNPLVEIVGSILLGALMGVLFTYVEKLFASNSKRLCLSITFVLLTVALSMLHFEIGSVHVGFSSLLVCMMLGTVFCNLCEHSEELMDRCDKWTMPIFVLFFVLSGAELELGVFADLAVVGVGVVYILFRSLGKCIGAHLSSAWMKCDPQIVKYLGITLLPQAGVALGMSLTASSLGSYEGTLIRNITLFAVLVYELVGPMMTKIALTKAGEIVPKNDGDAK
jgi:Kef-type K+ transport system membrane component KefB